jgi:hypothetical protein
MSQGFGAPNSRSFYSPTDDSLFQEFANPEVDLQLPYQPWLSNNSPFEGHVPHAPHHLAPIAITETFQLSSTQSQTQGPVPEIPLSESGDIGERTVAKKRKHNSYGRGGKFACTLCRDAKRGWDVSHCSVRLELIDCVIPKTQHFPLSHPVRSVSNGARPTTAMDADCHLKRKRLHQTKLLPQSSSRMLTLIGTFKSTKR